MSSKSNKSPEYIDPVQFISLDEIITTVAKFEYGIDSNSLEKYKDQNKTKKSYNLAQFKKEKLSTILQILDKLKFEDLSRDTNRELKIKELYDLLKSKLSSDLYLLNINTVIKYLHRCNDKKFDIENTIFKLLFDTILADVSDELHDLLPENDYNSLSDLFFNDTEVEFQKIIKSAVGLKKNDDGNSKIKKDLSLIYIYIVLKNRARYDFYKGLFIVERILAEHLAEIKSEESITYLHKILPESLLENNYKDKIRSFIYLYLTPHNNELKKNVESLTTKLNDNLGSVDMLSKEIIQFKEQAADNKTKLTQLTENVKEKDNMIASLKAEIIKKNDLLDFEVNKYERQLKGLRNGLMSKMKEDLQLEIEGITEITNRLQQQDQVTLRCYIRNITQLLDTL
jgi:hypothetical protein